MTDLAFQHIVERIINNAMDSLNEAKENPGSEYHEGHKLANYEILDIIKVELDIRDENLSDYGLDMDLDKVFL